MSASASLVCVPPDRVAAIWPLVADRLRRAVLRTDLAHSDDIEADVKRGNGLLWLALRGNEVLAAATTLLVRTDSNLVCVLQTVGGGSMESWFPLLSGIEAWAKAEGAAKLRIFGRRGWERLLPDYHVASVVLERSL